MAICCACKREVFRYIVRGGVDYCIRCSTVSSGYQPFKAYVDMNIAEEPVLITSDRQREKLMKQNNLVVRPREHVDDLNHRRWLKGMAPVRE